MATSTPKLTVNSLPNGVVENYKDLKRRFRTHIKQQKKQTKTYLAINSISRREGESIQAFITRYTDETTQINKLNEDQRITGFIHRVKIKSQVEFVSTERLESYDELIDKVYSWLQSKETASEGRPIIFMDRNAGEKLQKGGYGEALERRTKKKEIDIAQLGMIPSTMHSAVLYQSEVGHGVIMSEYQDRLVVNVFESQIGRNMEAYVHDMVTKRIGPLPEAPGKVKFLIVVKDYFTKWVGAKPPTGATRKHVKRFVWEHVVYRFGISQMTVLDSRRQFEEGVSLQFCKRFKNLSNLYLHIPSSKQGFNEGHEQRNSQRDRKDYGQHTNKKNKESILDAKRKKIFEKTVSTYKPRDYMFRLTTQARWKTLGKWEQPGKVPTRYYTLMEHGPMFSRP
nr:reverse transcriptase domain-containing protein [Tanacetum cinerariifolium]